MSRKRKTDVEISFDMSKPLATMSIDTDEMTIDNLELNNNVDSPLSQDNKDTNQILTAEVIKTVLADIWKNIDNGKIDLSYAVIGVTANGRQVYGYEELLRLLQAYGYPSLYAVVFVNNFQYAIDEDEKYKNDKTQSPLIMHTIQGWTIFSKIKKLKHLNIKNKKK